MYRNKKAADAKFAAFFILNVTQLYGWMLKGTFVLYHLLKNLRKLCLKVFAAQIFGDDDSLRVYQKVGWN